jgi:hypothetical protein
VDPKIKELKSKIAQLEKEMAETKSKDGKKKPAASKQFVPLKVYYKWTSPSRVFIQRDKAWFLKIAIVALLGILFFAFLQDFMVILVICIVVLIAFLLGSVPPRKATHKITNKGIDTINTEYKWDDMKEFWLAEKNGFLLLYINTKLRFPSRLMMIVDKKDEDKVVRLVGQKLEYAEYEKKQGWISKMSDGEMRDPAKYVHLFKSGKNKKQKKSSNENKNPDKKYWEQRQKQRSNSQKTKNK